MGWESGGHLLLLLLRAGFSGERIACDFCFTFWLCVQKQLAPSGCRVAVRLGTLIQAPAAGRLPLCLNRLQRWP